MNVRFTERAKRHLRAVDPHQPSTTHEERAQWISERIGGMHPTHPDFEILWDLFRISLDRDIEENGR